MEAGKRENASVLTALASGGIEGEGHTEKGRRKRGLPLQQVEERVLS